MIRSALCLEVISLFIFFGSCCPLAASGNRTVWQKIAHGFEVAEAQTWQVRNVVGRSKNRQFQYTAIRFHLGFYKLKLIDVTTFAKEERERIAKTQGANKNLGAFAKAWFKGNL